MNCSMLESAGEYAVEWARAAMTRGEFVIVKFTVGEKYIPEPDWVGTEWDMYDHFILKRPVCSCRGGIPMIKPDCPRHGHLTRDSSYAPY